MQNKQETNREDQSGFTLLEMLVTISILAAIAFITTGWFRGVREDSNDQLVRSEMQAIAKAIRQFKQDTGYYPGVGPFALSSIAPNGATDCPAMVPGDGGVDRDSLPGGAGGAWFSSPANFWQLLERPQLCANHPLAALANWNPDTGRGWRGPYLKGFAEGFVDIRDDINSYANGSNGDPLVGNNIQDVIGIADPFEHKGENAGGDTLLDWSATYLGAVANEREYWGRPYLLFDISTKPWLVSMGGDGIYNQGATSSDDVVLFIE